MKLNKKDFIEINFTGKTSEGEVFDSNIAQEIKKANLNLEAKPFAFCLGEDMFLKGVDEFLIDKDIGKYKIELSPEKGFGNRDSKLVKMVPMKVFIEQKLNPFPGAVFNFDGRIAKILTVSGGRVMVDFNNPLAGKEIVYDVEVVKKIDDLNEKVKSLSGFLFRKDFKFELKEKKLIMEVEKPMVEFVEMFKDKFKEILDLDLDVKEVKETLKAETPKTPQ